MSVHTLLNSNMRDFGTLLTILNENGIPWWEINAYRKATGQYFQHAIEAVISGETVMIFQAHAGDVIVFQSQSYTFRNQSVVEYLANTVPEEVRRQRQRAAEQQRQALERQRREAEQRRQREAEERRIRDEERRKQLAEQQRLDAERRRAEEERLRKQREEEARRREAQRKQEEERKRLEAERQRREEEARQQQLAQEASAILARMDSKFGQPPVSAPPPPPPPPAPQQAQPQPDPNELNRVIGRIHQENARKKILDALPELEEQWGLSLDNHERLEDETIEITLRR